MTTPLSSSLDPPSASTRQPLVRGVVFRFAFAYWMLFCIPSLAYHVAGFQWLGKLFDRASEPMAVWVGTHVLAIPYELTTEVNGSGDRTVDWVWVLCATSIALITTVVWSLVDRRSAHDARLRELLRVVVRYALAFTVLDYGVDKLFLGQFPPPGDGRLVQRFGEASPMGLLWAFMGASPAYVFFSGAGETLGAVLLLFRRTTTLGALVLAVVLTNVVMLNFCYDVPVKIFSSHLLALCVFVMLPDLGRLARMLLFNRATQPVARDLVLPRRWMRVARLVLKYAVISVALFTTVKANYAQRPVPDSDAWYGGYWDVTTFVRDGHDVPAVVADATRWKRLSLHFYGDEVYLRWRTVDDSVSEQYKAVIDENARTISLTPAVVEPTQQAASPIVLRYERVDANHLKLDGKIGAETLVVQLEHVIAGTMLLTTRGFHWINEAPFNR